MADHTAFLLPDYLAYQSGTVTLPVPPTTASNELADDALGPASRVEGSLNLPEAAHTAFLLDSHLDRIMERILVKPKVINVGTILGVRQFEGIIWNTHWATPITLDAISAQGDNTGIVIQGLAVDDVITPRRDRVITYQVNQTGPITIDVTLQFAFDLGTVLQSMLGARGIVVTLRPLSEGYVESIAYATDIAVSDNGKEYRTTRLPNGGPIRSAVFPFRTRTPEQATQMIQTLQFGVRFSVQVPLWGSQMELTGPVSNSTFLPVDTTAADFDNLTNVLVIEREERAGQKFEVRNVVSIGASQIEVGEALDGFAAGDLVVPLVQMTPGRENEVDYNDTRAVGTLNFEELR